MTKWHCSRWPIRKVYRPRPTIPIADRFWRKVNKEGPVQRHMATACWEWTASVGSHGYGVIQSGRRGARLLLAHQFSYSQFFGPIPKDAQVQHACDNRRCVNPDHLKLGTPRDNIHDALARGRWHPPGLFGERHPQAKLTDANVIEIRNIYALGGMTQATLAEFYGVERSTIGYAIKGKRVWRHILGPI